MVSNIEEGEGREKGSAWWCLFSKIKIILRGCPAVLGASISETTG